jgi:hypothetical protein
MAQHLSTTLQPASDGATGWHVGRYASELYSIDGAAFDEAGLKAMRCAFDDVCREVAPRAAPAEREFIAWLIVRLSCRGLNDGQRLKAAALTALGWRAPGRVAV